MNEDEPHLVVVSCDPGITTGWAIHRVPCAYLLERGQVGAVSRMWWRLGQYNYGGDTSASVDAFLEIGRRAYERMGEEDLLVLVYEGFHLMMLSGDDALLEPVRFGAVLRDRLRGKEGMVLEEQRPGERSIVTDVRLKTWGLYEAGKSHGRDAQRHGLAYLRRWASQPHLRKRSGWEGD